MHHLLILTKHPDEYRERIQAARKRYGLDVSFDGLDLGKFKVPGKVGDQRDLFG